jgi:acyl dehydratase
LNPRNIVVSSRYGAGVPAVSAVTAVSTAAAAARSSCSASIAALNHDRALLAWCDTADYFHQCKTGTWSDQMNPPNAILTLAGLKALLNTEVGVSEYLTVDQERINQFAAITEDWQWIHVDIDRARKESRSGATVAHGFLTLSLLSRFLNSVLEVRDAKTVVSVGLNSVRFITPLVAGGRIRGRVRMREHAQPEGFVQVTWRVTGECEGNRFPCFTADWVVRYYA